MKYIKTKVCICFSLVFICCMMYFVMRLALEKRAYSFDVTLKINEFLLQQQSLLQSMHDKIAPLIKKNEIENIAILLNAYEEHMYILSKRNVNVSSNIYFISLDAPQFIVGSTGLLDAKTWNYNPYYYAKVAENPGRIVTSTIYAGKSLPEYKLVNIGFSSDKNKQYLGQLDLHIAVAAIHQILSVQRLQHNWFDFKFNENIENPIIYMRTDAYWQAIIRPSLLTMMFFIVVSILGIICYACILYVVRLRTNLANNYEQIVLLKSETSIYKNVLSTQYKYGALRENIEQPISLYQIFMDAKTINMDMALAKGINIDIDCSGIEHIQVLYGIYLIQIFAGIIYETIKQLPKNSYIDVQVSVQEAKRQQNPIILFTLNDNGFYTELVSQPETKNIADIRAKGWEHIKLLLAQIQADMEFTHVAYQGNTILVSFVPQQYNNVINLAFQ